MSEWKNFLSSPIGTKDEVKAKLSQLFPHLDWRAGGVDGRTWFGYGANRVEGIQDFLIAEDRPGEVHVIIANRADPYTLISVMDLLDLNYVFRPRSNEFFDPHKHVQDPSA
jgi:hypothetical protein